MSENGQLNNKRFFFSHKNNVVTVGPKLLKNYQEEPTTTSKTTSIPLYVKLSAKSTHMSTHIRNNQGIETSKNLNNPISAKYSQLPKTNIQPKLISKNLELLSMLEVIVVLFSH